MNIKDTITELGLDVENLPRILKQRVETVEDLVSKVALAEKEVADEPTEESQAKLEEVTNYTDEYLKDVQEQLTSYKAKWDKKADEKQINWSTSCTRIQRYCIKQYKPFFPEAP